MSRAMFGTHSPLVCSAAASLAGHALPPCDACQQQDLACRHVSNDSTRCSECVMHGLQCGSQERDNICAERERLRVEHLVALETAALGIAKMQSIKRQQERFEARVIEMLHRGLHTLAALEEIEREEERERKLAESFVQENGRGKRQSGRKRKRNDGPATSTAQSSLNLSQAGPGSSTKVQSPIKTGATLGSAEHSPEQIPCLGSLDIPFTPCGLVSDSPFSWNGIDFGGLVVEQHSA
ncbi:uncharacterized protein K452DRAFT_360960 [Aplosporella prunicola CBS 121167]|uniref:Zn(2)-C6 fungal-type domain-containing protein n=1 Tax=Aplosporella prunicola CBS 121167 TaxID=1176127 RepID=A0A6A6B5M0_9PEZI|nr:uncharacterized protein K452DRAFT_360960 [Aplosporella prunicola CBS 121167]KAF2138723.1 hypothetical protein K452DRAFT_360960 [Aplosporella prunicola CBS 121167]